MQLTDEEQKNFIKMVGNLPPKEGRKSYKMTRANYKILCQYYGTLKEQKV